VVVVGGQIVREGQGADSAHQRRCPRTDGRQTTGRFTFRDARLALRPAENVEYWIGASARPAIDRAARLADGFLASPSLTLDEARDQAAFYLERCKAHGRTPRAVAIRRDIYVGESAADADAVKETVLAAGYRGIAPAALVTGSVESVVERFAELAALGYTDVIVRHLTNDQPKVLGSLARLRRVREALASV
jgi:alkanesulfonate monooxygenase SsuD/methylene tetrahydromethanopterin reductase-like flavin-dependent oxidoreductase (luciferase family)